VRSSSVFQGVSAAAQSPLVGTLFVLIGALGFSIKAILIKLAYHHGPQVDASTVMALRMLLALPFFVAAALWVSRDKIQDALGRREWAAVVGLGLLGYYLSSYLDFSGLLYISAGLERIILFVYPTLVVLATIAMGRRNIGRREVAALVVTYGGLLLVFSTRVEADNVDLFKGSLLVFASAITFALFTLGSGELIARIGPARFTAYSMIVACAATVLHYAWVHGAARVELPSQVYGLGLSLAVFSTVIPAFFLAEGIRRIGAAQASIVSSCGPVLTIAFAYAVLGEVITVVEALGTVVVVAGVLLVTRTRS
jgi:drug/metabolite transporter (DMT)-like permease